MVARLPVPDARGSVHHVMPRFKTSKECDAYIEARTEAWKAAKEAGRA